MDKEDEKLTRNLNRARFLKAVRYAAMFHIHFQLNFIKLDAKIAVFGRVMSLLKELQ